MDRLHPDAPGPRLDRRRVAGSSEGDDGTDGERRRAARPSPRDEDSGGLEEDPAEPRPSRQAGREVGEYRARRWRGRRHQCLAEHDHEAAGEGRREHGQDRRPHPVKRWPPACQPAEQQEAEQQQEAHVFHETTHGDQEVASGGLVGRAAFGPGAGRDAHAEPERTGQRVAVDHAHRGPGDLVDAGLVRREVDDHLVVGRHPTRRTAVGLEDRGSGESDV
jgi:hypothetical protein